MTFDKDEQSGTKIGNDYEPVLGLTFGWNLWDCFSAELQGLYTTARTEGRREQIASANVYGRYFLILDQLTDFKSLKILPTFKGGLALRIASLPGNPASTDKALTTFGWGPSFGGGLSFIAAKYVFFGFEVQGDLLFFEDKRQDLTSGGGAPGTLVYKGGFYPQLTALGFAGVHF